LRQQDQTQFSLDGRTQVAQLTNGGLAANYLITSWQAAQSPLLMCGVMQCVKEQI
jgi:hypothetical protein